MVLSLLPFLLAALPQVRVAPEVPQVDVQAALDAVISRNNGHGGGVMRVSMRGQVLWQGTSGQLTVNGAPMAKDCAFEIASTSKAVTAAAVLVLVEEGLLDLDTPIGQILPPGTLPPNLLLINGHDYGPDLTLRQCLSHTAGLPDYWYDPPYVLPGFNAFLLDYSLQPQKFWTPQEILSYVPGLTPRFLPGTGWHYSDSGYLLAGLAMETVTGQTLQEVLRTRVFDRLGMNDTWLRWRDPDPGWLTMSHRYEGTWDMTTKRHNSADWAGGGLASTTADLERFLTGVAEGRLFRNPATLAEMKSWVPTGEPGVEYGLGLFRAQLTGHRGWVWGHDGYGNSWVYYWPKHRVCFSGTLNQTENDWWWLVEAAAWQIDP
ncbi:MAG: class A beta-lactamase-related serine hydrolase [Planctomycetota bacterium]|nr:MAG: class A beta-lactamase-related serine hydrolase [Planctomycetota bacterium]